MTEFLSIRYTYLNSAEGVRWHQTRKLAKQFASKTLKINKIEKLEGVKV